MAKKLTDEMMAEIERKANAGEKLTDPTAEKQYYYDSIINKNNQADKPTWEKPQMPDFGANKPGDYNSQYGSQIDNLLNQILNKPDFSYDAESDPLYQQYKDKYNREGDRAMQNSMSEASNLTGGRMNSYAMTAGQQAQDYYNTKLTDKIPELQQLAYGMYNDKYNQMSNNLGLLQSQDQMAYGRWQDSYNRWDSDRNFNYNAWMNNANMDYNQYRDSMSDYYNDRDYNRQEILDKYNVGYAGERDTINDDRYTQEWQNTLSQQQQAQNNWLAEFNYKKQQDAIDNAYRASSRSSGGKSSSSGSSSEKSRYSNTEIKSKINSMMKEQVEAGKDKFGAKIYDKAYTDNQIIEWLVANATEEQANNYIDYYGLEWSEREGFMKYRTGKQGSTGGAGLNTWYATNR